MPAAMLTASFIYPPLFGVTGYFTILIIGYCGIALAYASFALVYMAYATERPCDYIPHRYWIFALTNGLPFIIGLFMVRWWEMG